MLFRDPSQNGLLTQVSTADGCFDAKQLYGLHLTLGPCLCEHVNVDVHNCECMQPHIVYHCVCVFTLVFVYHSALAAWEWSVVMELCASEPGQ